MFLRIAYIKDSGSVSHDASLAQLASLRASFRGYCFTYFTRELSVKFHSVVWSESVPPLSTGGIKGYCQTLNENARIMFLDGHQFLTVMPQMYKYGDL